MLRCSYKAGALIGCTSVGTFPRFGSEFTHDCAAFELGTSTPGGFGPWSCLVQHA